MVLIHIGENIGQFILQQRGKFCQPTRNDYHVNQEISTCQCSMMIAAFGSKVHFVSGRLSTLLLYKTSKETYQRLAHHHNPVPLICLTVRELSPQAHHHRMWSYLCLPVSSPVWIVFDCIEVGERSWWIHRESAVNEGNEESLENAVVQMYRVSSTVPQWDLLVPEWQVVRDC